MKEINFYLWLIFQWSATHEKKGKEEDKGSLRYTQKYTP